MKSFKAKTSSLGADDDPPTDGIDMTLANSSGNNHSKTTNTANSQPYKRVATADVETAATTEEEQHESDRLLNDDDNDNEYKDNNDQVRRHKQPQQQWQRASSSDNSCFFVGAWLCLIIMLGIFILGLNQWRRHEIMSHRGGTANGTSTTTNKHRSYDNDDDDDNYLRPNKDKDEKGTFYFDPAAAVQSTDLLDLATESVRDFYANTLVPPVWQDDTATTDSNKDRLGYMMQPNIVNGTVAFVSEGDLYWTSLSSKTSTSSSNTLPAMKLTTTVGNVRNPAINPKYPYWIAYTATYTARRDVYLIDLRRKTHGQHPAMRLTYWPDSFGVRGIVGWREDGTTLVIEAFSNTISLPDVRMYELTLAIAPSQQTETRRRRAAETSTNTNTNNNETSPEANNTDSAAPKDGDKISKQEMTIHHPQVLQMSPVPFAQAINGVYHDHERCWYFTRIQQSSNTARYQGGTAEAIWAWCEGHELAVVLTTHQFNGTSKEPSIFTLETADGTHAHYMLFLSDRGPNTDPNDPNEWKATTMNLWAMLLPRKEDLDPIANPPSHNGSIPAFRPSQFIQLTQVSCEFGGMPLKEYSLDPVTQNVVLRIGADLYWMSAESIRQKLLHPPSLRRALHQEETANDSTAASNSESMQKKQESQRTEKQQTKGSQDIHDLGVLVFSDFHEHQERILPISMSDHLVVGDVYETAFGQVSFLMTVRGQTWVAPVVEDKDTLDAIYRGAGRNMPRRRYRVAPGARMGGAVRILASRHVPVLMEDKKSAKRLAVILATDPGSPTAEHAFYLIEIQSDALPIFVSFEDLPEPFLGGHKGGGGTREGGLGTVRGDSVSVSPCSRRMAWVDTDGRICVMALPLYKELEEEYGDYTVLPKENELREPLVGAEAELKWSPGGRYLAVEHNARNQFTIISIVDCGDPLMPGSEAQGEKMDEKAAGIKLGRIVQATPDRFNSFSAYWGKSNFDQNYFAEAESIAEAFDEEPGTELATTTLFFLTDRDVLNEANSPWGTRAPSPFFKRETLVYAIPLMSQKDDHSIYAGHFSGGGAEELFVGNMLALKRKMESKRRMTSVPSAAPIVEDAEEKFPQDPDVDFGPPDLSFARKAYRLANIPLGVYSTILAQSKDDSSFLLVEEKDGDDSLKIVLAIDFPSDKIDVKEAPKNVTQYGLSTSRDHVFIVFDDTVKIVSNTASGFMSIASDEDIEENIAFTDLMAISVWPALEYQQMYADAWRLMRDFFYDPDMTGIDWYRMFERYLPLVSRCAKREELDDVLEYMASEVSALHVFVYGGEYSSPLAHDDSSILGHLPASLAVTVERSAEWKGYMITALPEIDPDFSMLDRDEVYSPLSDRVMRLSGQKGLKVGDVIVAINGESVMQVPDMHALLRGMQYQSIRLDVLRLASSPAEDPEKMKPEPVIVVPLDPLDDVFYHAWEWRTRQRAKKLAKDAGFSVGYIHLRSMSSPEDEDAFARGYFPDYDKDALIVDVRHNKGGNIDWWLLDVLQRKAWMYWDGRAYNASTGGLGWDEQFAFRGHIVVVRS